MEKAVEHVWFLSMIYIDLLCKFTRGFWLTTLPETNIAPENLWLEDDPFPFGWPIIPPLAPQTPPGPPKCKLQLLIIRPPHDHHQGTWRGEVALISVTAFFQGLLLFVSGSVTHQNSFPPPSRAKCRPASRAGKL